MAIEPRYLMKINGGARKLVSRDSDRCHAIGKSGASPFSPTPPTSAASLLDMSQQKHELSLQTQKKFGDIMGELLTPNDLLGTSSYVVFALSYLMTNIFWLRVSAVVGLFLEIAYFQMAGGDLKIGIIWGIVFISINLYQLFRLVRERARVRLPEKDAPFLREALAGLNDSQISKLLTAADWRDAKPGETLTQQDAAVEALYFLCSGRASVAVNGSLVTYLEKGAFVGEMAYLTGKPATATVGIDEPSRILVLSKSRMAKITSTDGQIAGIIHQLLGRDLATKMSQSNTRIALGSKGFVSV